MRVWEISVMIAFYQMGVWCGNAFSDGGVQAKENKERDRER